jgi:hypothetical protein
MSLPARLCTAVGTGALLLTVVNQLTAPALDPALERGSVLAALLAVGLLLIGVLWTRLQPEPAARAPLQGDEGMLLRRDLSPQLADELSWGTRMLLTATPAAVVLVLWDGDCLIHRGLMDPTAQQRGFVPGPVCQMAWQRDRSIHLVDLRHYPGRDEFMPLLEGLPSVIVQPLGRRGLVVLGGWSPRCFSTADQLWIEGWALRLRDAWLLAGQAVAEATPASRAPGTLEQ